MHIAELWRRGRFDHIALSESAFCCWMFRARCLHGLPSGWLQKASGAWQIAKLRTRWRVIWRWLHSMERRPRRLLSAAAAALMETGCFWFGQCADASKRYFSAAKGRARRFFFLLCDGIIDMKVHLAGGDCYRARTHAADDERVIVNLFAGCRILYASWKLILACEAHQRSFSLFLHSLSFVIVYCWVACAFLPYGSVAEVFILRIIYATAGAAAGLLDPACDLLRRNILFAAFYHGKVAKFGRKQKKQSPRLQVYYGCWKTALWIFSCICETFFSAV